MLHLQYKQHLIYNTKENDVTDSWKLQDWCVLLEPPNNFIPSNFHDCTTSLLPLHTFKHGTSSRSVQMHYGELLHHLCSRGQLVYTRYSWSYPKASSELSLANSFPRTHLSFTAGTCEIYLQTSVLKYESTSNLVDSHSLQHHNIELIFLQLLQVDFLFAGHFAAWCPIPKHE